MQVDNDSPNCILTKTLCISILKYPITAVIALFPVGFLLFSSIIFGGASFLYLSDRRF
jgi:hypothetical protein